ncbi:glycerophosphoryl diester phosphodiesterase membrane domain-containing protein [Mesorhizobium sp. LHD-90]|uniref:glycerophosphoryl diester phosphodiesterase membrane domain-containing protein n=1 Tax=Mesorhizobium sp. LHD-90 TaxID=3071414 RepID=UPI0027E1BF0E|nr:glycerophosphoryl diester phosphodiesterase membrane domain-containing protein [Mesorhizobium sp. LHD-90]MDQ6432802.1 glycerophosphoryl diester phosphodiesterase membrane domain-containing protein [Mesorhizobium sp. LHD-90]
MSMASYDRPAAFRIGRVFGDTFSVLGRNFGLCLGLAVIFSGIPTFLYQLLTGSQIDAALLSAETGAVPPPEFEPTSALAGLVYFIIYLVLASILQAALVRTTIEDLNGQQPTFADALSRGIAVLLPIIGLLFLMYLGIGIGFVLLIIPGLYLLIRWSAAVPALVHERLGVLESMRRSSELTKGSRWRIFGLFVILIVAIWILQLVLGLLALAIMPILGTVLATALVAVLSAVTSVIASIAMAVAYVELRYVKEGTDVKQLAEIFA